jgi:hypothetical protein
LALPLLLVFLAVVIVLTTVLSSPSRSVHPAGWGKPPPPSLTLTPRTAIPTAEMFDTVTLSSLSGLRPVAVAGYTSGFWPTYLSLVHAFPGAHVVSVAISASHHANCLDIEPGDASPSQAPAWVRADIAAGFKRPCLYSSWWEFVNQVRPALAHAGISRASVWEWDASYTGLPGITPGFDATQWTNKSHGRNLDESTVSLAFLGIQLKPAKPALPTCIHHRLSKSACSAAKAKIATDQRAASSSQRAYRARGCSVLAQRTSWFSTQLKHHPKVKTASRRAALASSRTAYRQRSCDVFKRRADFFTSAASRIAAAS